MFKILQKRQHDMFKILIFFLILGTWPVDSTKYPRNRLDPRILEKYNKWKSSGQELNWDKLAEG